MSNDLTNDLSWMSKIIADECNVKQIIINGVIIHKESMISDKYKEKQKKFDEIYGEYPAERK